MLILNVYWHSQCQKWIKSGTVCLSEIAFPLSCIPKSVLDYVLICDQLYKQNFCFCLFLFFFLTSTFFTVVIRGYRARFQKACIYLNHHTFKVRK